MISSVYLLQLNMVMENHAFSIVSEVSHYNWAIFYYSYVRLPDGTNSYRSLLLIPSPHPNIFNA